MPLPAGVDAVTVTSGQPLVLPDGTPYEGSIEFIGPRIVTVAGQDVVLGGSVEVDLVGGAFSIALAATDVAGMAPSGWSYTVKTHFTNALNWVRYLQLPKAAPTVVLAAVLEPDPAAADRVVVTGPAGPRGSSVLNGIGVPGSGTGLDGDWYIDRTTPDALVIYGPKASGVWGSGQPIGGGAAGALLAANNLQDLQSASAARTHLGLGGAAVLDIGTIEGTVAAGDDLRFGVPTPWRFNIEDFGAKADVQVFTDGATQSGVARVTCATSTPFSLSSVGKICMVLRAGPSGVDFFASPITGISGAGTAILQDAPAQTIASGATVLVGTNCYDAINSAVDAAEDYLRGTGIGRASVPHPYAEVWTPPNAYIVHGPLRTDKEGNGQIVFGVYDTAKAKPGLGFEGASPVAASARHWQQLVPQGGGSCWISTFVYSSTTAQTNDVDPTANGLSAVISGPNEGHANGTSWGSLINGTATYSNITPVVRNMSFLTAHSSLGLGIGAANFWGCANQIVENVSESTLGIVPGTDYSSPGLFAAGFSIGWVCPSPGNNDMSYVRNLSIQGGHTFGIWATEHTLIDRLMVLYTWAALVVVGSYAGSPGASHAVKVIQASIEACTHEIYFMNAGSEGITMVDIDQLQTEDGSPNITGNTAAAINAAVGTVKLTGLFTADNVSTASPCGLKLINGQVPRAIRRITADHTATPLDRTIIADPAAGALTVTLPDAAFCAVEYTLKNSSSNVLTVATTGGQLIYATSSTGAATTTVATGASLRLQAAYTGSAWAWYTI